MEANELMVGDYLMYNGFPYRVIQVDGIVRDGWMIENGEEDCGDPIPITPEILEKNGFEKYKADRFNLNERWVCIQDGNRGDVTIEISFYQPPIFDVNILTKITAICSTGGGVNTVHSCDIKTVHQLQHALRLCGIEKTIEL